MDKITTFCYNKSEVIKLKENLVIKEVLKVFEGSFPKGRANDQPCRHSDAFCYIKEGEIEYTFSGKKVRAKEKNLIFFPKGSAYSLNIISPLNYICIDFIFESGSSLADGVVFKNISPDIGNIFPKLLKIYLMKSPWHQPSLFSGVYRIYTEALKSENAKYMKLTPIFSDITAYIIENVSNPDFSVSALSEKFGISEVHLRRILKSAVGTSPIRYVNSLRLEKAKTLLSESSLKVSDIAIESGFTDSFYFSRLFKKETGLSPASFRKTN